MRTLGFILYIFLISFKLSAQTPIANFSLENETICLGQSMTLENNSQNFSSNKWHFCPPILNNTSTSPTELTTNINLTFSYGFDLIKVDNTIRGLGVRNNGLVYRYTFNADFSTLVNTTAISSLATSNFSLPREIKIIKSNNLYFAFVTNSGTRAMTMLNFGNSLDNTPIPSDIILNETLIQTHGLDIIKHNNSLVLFSGKSNSNRIYRIVYEDTINLTNPTSSFFTLPNANDITGISLKKFNNQYIGLAVSNSSSKVYLLQFTNGLLNNPTVTEVITGETLNPTRVVLEVEQNKLFGFIQLQKGNVLKLDFAQSAENAPNTTLINYNGNTVFPLGIVKLNNKYVIYNIDIPTGVTKVNQITFVDNCQLNEKSSDEISPTLFYNQPGTYPTTLIVYDSFGNSSSVTKDINVTDKQAPLVSITHQDICLLNQYSPNIVANQSLVSFHWDFENGDTSILENPEYLFDTAGTYNITLKIESVNGCQNLTNKKLNVYDPPLASFTPNSITACVFNEINFENTSIANKDVAVYLWNFKDGTTTNIENPSHQFSIPNTYSVSLTTDILGCIDTYEQTITINSGPNSNFNVTDICLGEAADFTNLTQSPVPIDSYLWTFEENETSSEENPNHQYTTSGNKTVRLEANASNGCSNSTEKTFVVGAVPDVDFEISQACQDQIINFTPVASVEGSTVSSYMWSFGDENNTTSDRVFPEFSYNNPQTYNANLKVISEIGCENEITKPIDVLLAPQNGMTITAGCLGSFVSIQSTAASLNALNVIDYRFEVRNSNNQIVASGTNNILNFAPSQAGIYTVIHTITTSNFCSKTVTQTFEMLPTPQVSLNAFSTCVGNELTLQATTSLFGDEVVNWNWQISSLGNFNEENPVLTFTQSGQYWVQLNITTERGCNRSASSIINVINQPVAAFASTIVQSGNPTIVNFTNQSTGATQYEWLINNELLSNDVNPSTVLNNVGVNEITLIASNNIGCEDNVTRNYTVPEILLDLALNNITLSSSNEDNTIVLGISNLGSVNVSNYRINVDLGDEFSFFENSSTTLEAYSINTIELNTQFTDSRKTSIPYICVEVVSNEPSIIETNLGNNKTCLTLTENYQVLDPSPNPVRTSFTHSIVSDRDLGNVEFSIINYQGAQFGNYFIQVNKGYNKSTVDVSEFSPGAYFITTYIQGEAITRRFIVY